jgi:hypothetical protein
MGSEAISERIDSSGREKSLSFKELEPVRNRKTDQPFGVCIPISFDLLMIPPSPGLVYLRRDAPSAGYEYDSFAKIRRSGHICSQMPNPGNGGCEDAGRCEAAGRNFKS